MLQSLVRVVSSKRYIGTNITNIVADIPPIPFLGKFDHFPGSFFDDTVDGRNPAPPGMFKKTMKITGFQLPFPQLASWIFEPSTVLLKPLTTLRKTRFSELCQNLSSRFWTPRAPVLSWMCFSWVVVILFDPFYH